MFCLESNSDLIRLSFAVVISDEEPNVEDKIVEVLL